MLLDLVRGWLLSRLSLRNSLNVALVFLIVLACEAGANPSNPVLDAEDVSIGNWVGQSMHTAVSSAVPNLVQPGLVKSPPLRAGCLQALKDLGVNARGLLAFVF